MALLDVRKRSEPRVDSYAPGLACRGGKRVCIVGSFKERMLNRMRKLFSVLALSFASLAAAPHLFAQAQTEVPPVVPGAKPVIVEHIKIHGKALEGNLEGDAVDRDVLFSCRQLIKKRRTGAIPWSMRCMGTPSAPSSGLTKSTFPRPSKELLRKAPKK